MIIFLRFLNFEYMYIQRFFTLGFSTEHDIFSFMVLSQKDSSHFEYSKRGISYPSSLLSILSLKMTKNKSKFEEKPNRNHTEQIVNN